MLGAGIVFFGVLGGVIDFPKMWKQNLINGVVNLKNVAENIPSNVVEDTEIVDAWWGGLSWGQKRFIYNKHVKVEGEWE